MGVRSLGSYVEQGEVCFVQEVNEAGKGGGSPCNAVVESQRVCNIFAVTGGFRWNQAGFTA